jgi:hypothetical protein
MTISFFSQAVTIANQADSHLKATFPTRRRAGVERPSGGSSAKRNKDDEREIAAEAA